MTSFITWGTGRDVDAASAVPTSAPSQLPAPDLRLLASAWWKSSAWGKRHLSFFSALEAKLHLCFRNLLYSLEAEEDKREVPLSSEPDFPKEGPQGIAQRGTSTQSHLKSLMFHIDTWKACSGCPFSDWQREPVPQCWKYSMMQAIPSSEV